MTLICYYFHNIFLYFIVFIFLLLTEKQYVIIFILLTIIIYITNNYKYDYFPLGIVYKENYNQYIVDKLFYKVKIYPENPLKVGDILFFNKPYILNDYQNDITKNIIFKGSDYKIIYHLRIKVYLLNRINNFDDNTSSIINQILFNQYDYDNTNYNLGYGLITYYLLKNIKDKNKYLFLIFLIIFSILFQFDNKYFLLIIELISDNFNLDKYYRMSFKLIIISIINIHLFKNYSFIVPILFNLYSLIDLDMNFMTYLCLIESILFGEINFITTLLFNFLIKYKIFLFLMSLFVLVIPYFEKILLIFTEIITYLNNLNICLKGRITIFGLLIYLLIIKLFKVDKKYKLIFLLLIILSPINNPFMHISFIDVGQGDASLIKYALKRQCILIDTGSIYNYQKLKRQLDYEGIYEIEYLIISHNDSDHNGNIERLKKDYQVKNIIKTGQDIILDDIELKYLYIDEYDNDNDNSLVYLLDIEGHKILFTGDISTNVEKQLIKKYNLDIDILKLAHHGSYTSNSEYFISSILPKYGIISTSGQYNHPSDIVIDCLNKYNCKYFITKDDGNIKLYFCRLFELFKTDRGEFVIIR